jgi:hypothetical protein
MFDLATLLPALQSMTRRPVEAVATTTVRAAITAHRYLELSVEDGGAVSAWAVGSLLVAGKPVKFAVLVGRLFEPARLTQTFRKATGLIQEVISSGSRAATFLAKGVTADDSSMFIYSAPEVDPTLAVQWLSTFAERNRVELEADKPAAKVTNKSKSKLFGGAAASA